MAAKICGNCFSRLKNGRCPECGYTEDSALSDHDILPVGTVLNGRYVIGRLLGKGGFGITYLAYDKTDCKAVAVKEFYPEGTAVRSEDDVTVEPMTTFQAEDFSYGIERFINEAEIIMKLHGNSDILEVYDVFRANGTAYYAMEFFSGISLKAYVKQKGCITAEQAVYIMRRLLPALSAIHKEGVLHRDISPDNIMLCRDGRVRLIDFGSARNYVGSSDKSMSVILKEGFAPVEQYWRSGEQDDRTDIYSLGTSVYFALTGKAPENPIMRLENDSIFSEKLKAVKDELSGIIKKSAAVKKEDRYSSAEEMLNDTEGCGIDEKPLNVDTDNPSYEAVSKLRKRRKKNKLARRIAIIFSAAASAAAICISVFCINNTDRQVKIGGEFYSVNLTELDLENRELTNSQISNLRHMKKLTSLNLSNNYITDMSCLDGLTAIEYIYFDNNNVSDISFMGPMEHLKKISANNNSISDISVLEDKTELEMVFMGDNYITDISPLKNSRGLVYVGFDEAQIGNIDVLAGMDKLEMAGFSGCNLESIEPLADCASLRLVYFGRNRLTDVSVLKGKNIEELYLDNNNLSGHTDTFEGIILNGFACVEGNGFTEEEIQNIVNKLDGDFTVYY